MKLLKDLVSELFQQAFEALAKEPVEIRIEYARDEKFGDYACTSALDQRVRTACGASNPRQLAESVTGELRKSTAKFGKGDEIELTGAECFSRIDIAGPGFINVTLSNRLLLLILSGIAESAEGYGESTAADPRNIIFEFVSANPTGPLNVVSARAAALGDSCCNLLEAAGHKVFREYYVNDFGNQVNLLGLSCLLRFLESRGAKIQFSRKGENGPQYQAKPGLRFPDQGYHGEYLIDIVGTICEKNPDLVPPEPTLSELVAESGNTQSEGNAIPVLEKHNAMQYADEMGRAATEYLRASHESDLAAFRVRFDQFFSERTLHESNQVLDALNPLSAYIYESEGKKLFRSTDFQDDKDRVVVRDDGRPTYLLADIAYHRSKIQRGHAEIIDIWGPDHHGYVARLSGAMKALGFPAESFRVLIAQQVNLLSGGQPVVMSKRTGLFVTLRELIEEIPLDVVRYFFVMRSFESHLDFDLEEAKDTSDKNPYYYVGYAHARIRSIFRRSQEEGIIGSEEDLFEEMRPVNSTLPDLLQSQLDRIEAPERRRLLWLAARFPEEVREAADSFEPHRLINVLYMTAQALSRFYGVPENKILNLPANEARLLLGILAAVAICLRKGLQLLGMEAPERMSRDVSEESAST